MLPVMRIFFIVVAVRSLRPRLPGSLAGAPEIFQVLAIPQCVHWMPKTAVKMHTQLAFRGQPLERLALPNGRVALDVRVHTLVDDEEPRIDPAAVAFGLFHECRHFRSIVTYRTKSSRRLRGGYGREQSLALMQTDDLADVHIADAIAVSHAEKITFDVGKYALDAASDLGRLARFYERDTPRLRLAAMNFHLVLIAHVDRHVGRVQVIIHEVLFDHVSLVAEAHDEIVDPVRGIHLHDVPKNRLAADLDHRLGPNRCFFCKTGAETARQQHSLHSSYLR